MKKCFEKLIPKKCCEYAPRSLLPYISTHPLTLLKFSSYTEVIYKHIKTEIMTMSVKALCIMTQRDET